MGTFRPTVALTFDDVLLLPRHSSVHPRNVDTRSRFTRKLSLHIPLVAAAMDTVTESEMAIAMAREGGIGVIHKNMPVDRQAAEVDRVKRSESGMILHPITLGPDRPLREAVHLMERFRISGVPIVDDAGRLVGIITNRDLQFERQLDRPIRDAMTKDRLVTAPLGTTLDEAEKTLAKHRIEKLPVVGGNEGSRAGARGLVEGGVDAAEVGVGPGSICSIGVVTGVGLPRVTALLDAVGGEGGAPVIADGGIKYSGDVVKALAAGAQ